MRTATQVSGEFITRHTQGPPHGKHSQEAGLTRLAGGSPLTGGPGALLRKLLAVLSTFLPFPLILTPTPGLAGPV